MSEIKNGCTCDICKSMCKRPCWPTPEEAVKLIESGYGNKLMLDYWVDTNKTKCKNIYIVCPALKDYERKESPFWPRNEDGCTFWHKITKLCELHNAPSKDNSNLKPYEARMANCKSKSKVDYHKKVAKMWNNKEAQNIVKMWKENYLDEEGYYYE